MTLPVLLDDPFRKSYLRKVLSVEKANLIGLWLGKEAGGSVCYDFSGNDHHGTYVNNTLGQQGVPGIGYTCPLYDNDDCYINIYSAELAAAFSGAAGTVIVLAKVYNAEVWEDNTVRWILNIGADNNNRIVLMKSLTNNQLDIDYIAGGILKVISTGSLSYTDFMWLALTWDKTADQAIAYINGAQTGSTATGLGTWLGTPASTQTVIGARFTTPTSPWYGYIGPVALWTKALTATQVVYLS